uniref:Uncharacterized protein n=1 Tax=Salix viminalis TaxID=40686 RepID=A0A6N2KWC6_SALVM
MVPSGHLAASITHSQTAQEILKRVFLGSNLLLQSHEFFIQLSEKLVDGVSYNWELIGFRCRERTALYLVKLIRSFNN